MARHAARAHLRQGVISILDPTNLPVGTGQTIPVGIRNRSDAIPGSEENDYVYVMHGLPRVRDGRCVPSFASTAGIKATGEAYKAIKSKVDSAWHEQRW